MITRKGILLLTAGLLLALAGLAAGSVPLTLLGAALPLSLVASHLTSRFPAVAGTRDVPVERMFEGDAAEVRLRLANPGNAPAVVEAADALSPRLKVASAESVFTLALAPGETAERTYTLQAPIRGHYALPPTRYRLSDTFDNFAREGSFGSPHYLTVFPKRSELRDMPSRSRYPMGLMGEHNVMQPGQGLEFFGLREYQPGDPMKAVNWKASARMSDTLVVNQHEKETVAEVTILLDTRRITGRGTVGSNPLLHACRTAATIATLYLGRKDKVRLVTYGDRIHELASDTGERQLFKVLSLLAEVEPAGDLPALEAVNRVLPTLRPKSPVILVSSLEGDATAVEAASLLKGFNTPFVVATPSPTRCFSPDVDEEERRLVTAEREETVRQLRSYGARLIEVDPEADLQEALMVVGKQ